MAAAPEPIASRRGPSGPGGGASRGDVVQMRGISKTFPGQRAVDGVDFAVRAGEIHALVGQNGSGKSTLIKVLAGSHQPDPGGEVRVAGEPLPLGSPGESHRRGLRFVHQHFGVIDQLNAMENVALSSGYLRRRSGRIDWPRQRAQTERLLALIGLELDVDRPLGQYRPVDRAAVAIARALDDSAGGIQLLVLDEPTAALPPAEVDLLIGLVRQVRDAGVGVVYVSHRLEEVLGLADRVTVLRDGRLEATVDAESLGRRDLIRLIVGHVVDEQRPAAPSSSSAAARALSVQGLSGLTLRDVSLEVARGEVVGVAGILGSGREELPYALLGASPSTVDEMRVDDGDPFEPTPAACIETGLVLVPGNRQSGSSVPEFSVLENLTLPALADYRRGGRISRRAECAVVADWIKRVRVEPPDGGKVFAQLSGGNQQKVIVAKWLNTGPRTVVLDEPTAGVDVGAREALYDLIRHYAAEGTAFVVCSSDIDDLIAVCGRVVVLGRGRVVGELTGADISQQAILDAMSAGDNEQHDTTETAA